MILQIPLIEQITPKAGQMFNLTILILAGVLVYVAYYLAKQGRTWTIRPMEALDAIQEGIGRAAEMGRPVLMFPGIGNLQNPQTMAGLTMLGEIVERGARVNVPVNTIPSATEIVTASEAIVRDAYNRAGKPELYELGKYVKWYGTDQFVYAVGGAGHILAEKPAMVVFLGYFLADVLVTGEAGSRVGALQIGATADQSAVSLMALCCDYILIGEEMYAVTASITEDKYQIATIAGEDWIKALLLVLMVAGVLLTAAGLKSLISFMWW